MFDHSVENGQQFAHASDQGDLGCFTRVTQSFVEDPHDRIMSARDQGCHVEDCPYAGSAAPDSSTTSQGTTIPIERCYADQRCNLFTVELSKFWQLGQKGTTNHRTDTGDTPEQVFVLLPDRALTDALVQIFVGSLQFCFQPADVS